jgi:WD40 repeat protein
MALASDGVHLAICSPNAPTGIYAAATGELVRTLDPRAANATAIGYSEDGSRVLVGHQSNNMVVLCNADDGTIVFEERGSDFVVWDADISLAGGRVVSLGKDGQIWVRDVQDGSLRFKTATGRQNASKVRFSPDGKLVAIGGADGVITLFDTESGAKSRSLRGHELPIGDIAFEPDGKALVSGDSGGRLKRWALTGGWNDVRYQHVNALSCAAFAANDSQLFCGGESFGVIRIDLRAREKIYNDLMGAVWTVAPHPDGRRVAALGDVEGSRVVMLLDEDLRPRHTWSALNGVGLGRDGMRVLFVAPDRALVVHDAESGERLASLADDASDPFQSVAFSVDGHTILTGHAYGRVRVWDSATLGVEDWRGHGREPVIRLCFDPTGRHVASASSAGEVRVWSWPERELRGTLLTGALNAVAVSPDGLRVATAGADHMIHLWNVARGRQTMTAGRHHERVTSLRFSDDGRSLATTGVDHVLNVWRSWSAGGQ